MGSIFIFYKEMLNERDELIKSHNKRLEEYVEMAKTSEHHWIQEMIDSEGFYTLFSGLTVVKQREHNRDPITGRFVKKG